MQSLVRSDALAGVADALALTERRPPMRFAAAP